MDISFSLSWFLTTATYITAAMGMSTKSLVHQTPTAFINVHTSTTKAAAIFDHLSSESSNLDKENARRYFRKILISDVETATSKVSSRKFRKAQSKRIVYHTDPPIETFRRQDVVVAESSNRRNRVRRSIQQFRVTSSANLVMSERDRTFTAREINGVSARPWTRIIYPNINPIQRFSESGLLIPYKNLRIDSRRPESERERAVPNLKSTRIFSGDNIQRTYPISEVNPQNPNSNWVHGNSIRISSHSQPEPEPSNPEAEQRNTNPESERRNPYSKPERKNAIPESEQRHAVPESEQRNSRPESQRRNPYSVPERRQPIPESQQKNSHSEPERRNQHLVPDRKNPHAEPERRNLQTESERRNLHPEPERRNSHSESEQRNSKPEPERRNPYSEPEQRISYPEPERRNPFSESDPQNAMPESEQRNFRTEAERRHSNPEAEQRNSYSESERKQAIPESERRQSKPEPERKMSKPELFTRPHTIPSRSNHGTKPEKIPQREMKPWTSRNRVRNEKNPKQDRITDSITVPLPKLKFGFSDRIQKFDWKAPVIWPQLKINPSRSFNRNNHGPFPWWQERVEQSMLSTVKPFTQRQRSDVRPSTDDPFRNFLQQTRNKTVRGTLNPSTDRCIMLVATGDCNFYRCFDETHTCPADQNFAFNVGNHLCRQVESFINFFDETGKEYLRNMKRCHMAAFVPTLRSNAPTCSQIEVTGFDILNGGILPLNHNDKSCFFQHGSFCQLLEDPQNTQLFYDLYGGHGYTEYRLFVHFMKLLEHCSNTARRTFNKHYASKFVIYDEYE